MSFVVEDKKAEYGIGDSGKGTLAENDDEEGEDDKEEIVEEPVIVEEDKGEDDTERDDQKEDEEGRFTLTACSIEGDCNNKDDEHCSYISADGGNEEIGTFCTDKCD